MFRSVALLSFTLLAVVYGQNVGTQQAENHPAITYQHCTGNPGTCTTINGQIVLDSNWRWTHTTTGTTNCYTGNTWDATLCPNPTTCTTNCAIDGADYPGTYGISTSGNALTLKFITVGPYSTNIGSRTYLMNSATTYQ